ncbi:MAG: hypothetical protein WDZ51_00205 [Pirellulaceae bacterium]
MADNNYFLPGDAFFPTVLTQKGIEQLKSVKTGERMFAYSSLGGYDGAFCGYAGYYIATIPAVDDAFANNLATVYARIREDNNRELLEVLRDGKTELVETNGVRVLFYPPEFEFPRHTLGLRYNENWASEAVKFGHRREHLRLCCLIQNPDAVVISWRDAEAVAALKVKLPEIDLKPVPVTETPVEVQGPVKSIVVGSHTLEELFRLEHDDYATVYIVDSEGFTKLKHHDGEWRPEDTE